MLKRLKRWDAKVLDDHPSFFWWIAPGALLPIGLGSVFVFWCPIRVNDVPSCGWQGRFFGALGIVAGLAILIAAIWLSARARRARQNPSGKPTSTNLGR